MDDSIHKGHRQRMRRKFSDYGARVFDTYELLEMLLYHTVPLKDTNPIAKKLLSRFGSIDGVLRADVSELMEIEGVGQKTAELIKTASEALELYKSASDNDDAKVYESYYELGDFISDYFAQNFDRDDYSVALLSFDNSMRLIRVDKIYDVDYSSGAVRPGPFVSSLVSSGASVAVIAHNHPHGPLYPTEGDRQTNFAIENALMAIGIFLIEHYIVCGDNYLGFMHHLQSAFAQSPALRKFYSSKESGRGR